MHLQVPEHEYPTVVPVAGRGRMRGAAPRSRGLPGTNEGPCGWRRRRRRTEFVGAASHQHPRRRRRIRVTVPLSHRHDQRSKQLSG